MAKNGSLTKWTPLALVVTIALILFWVGWVRLRIDTDITGVLPADDPILSDAASIVKNHPMQDLVAIDLQHQRTDPAALAEAATFVEKRLVESGLFRQVGTKRFQQVVPMLLESITRRLPQLFTRQQLNSQVEPLLQPDRLRQLLDRNIKTLLELQGLGQAQLLVSDPLGLRNLVLAGLAQLFPVRGRIYKGHLMSADRRHALLLARPLGSGTDTAVAKKLQACFLGIEEELNRRSADQGLAFTLTPVGAFRAALDNENIVRRDVQRLLAFAALGIVILLLLAFPRPSIGLLALVPAVAGTLVAFFVFSLWRESISIMSIGFGGAIISITVDHGIAFLLFLDRPGGSSGRQAARELWSVGLLAALTTIGAFTALHLSGFPLLVQIGQFAATGIAASFLFVHSVFPLVIPPLRPARSEKTVFLQRIVPRLFRAGGKYKALAALGLGLVAAAFGRPDFNTDFRAMNTVTPQTAAAEKKVVDIWGDVRSRIFVMTEADSLPQLQRRLDRLTDVLQVQVSSGQLASAFTPSLLFPGQDRARENLAHWQAFWNDRRKDKLQSALSQVSQQWGFTKTAFSSFLQQLDQTDLLTEEIPAPYFDLLAVDPPANGGSSRWKQFATLQPGSEHNASDLVDTIAGLSGTRVFDPAHFSEKLGRYLASTFLRMAAIIGISVAVLVLFFFFDWRLAGAALLPVAFALSCTLGTLRLIGHPLDIPGLMLSIVVMGMGVDYAIFLVRGYQRYRRVDDASMVLIQTAVFLAAASTLIGFGTLNFAQHRLLQSAGMTCMLGVGYAFLGSFLILPPILQRIFSAQQTAADVTDQQRAGSVSLNAGVRRRYRHAEALQRLYTIFRLHRDPLFSDLEPVPDSWRLVVDIGTGIGVPAAWLLEASPQVRIFGIEPHPDRARLAAMALGGRAQVHCMAAPRFPDYPERADAAVMIDVLHLLSDQTLQASLKQLGSFLQPRARVVIRCPILQNGRVCGVSAMEKLRYRLVKPSVYMRTAEEIIDLFAEGGFEFDREQPAADGRKGRWFVFNHSAI